MTVKRLVIAKDCGPISNPDGLRNQLEGGALQGMSRALARGSDVGRSEGDVGRLADLSTAVSRRRGPEDRDGADQSAGRRRRRAPAKRRSQSPRPPSRNAIFDATGARIRQAPFTAARIKAALDARS